MSKKVQIGGLHMEQECVCFLIARERYSLASREVHFNAEKDKSSQGSVRA